MSRRLVDGLVAGVVDFSLGKYIRRTVFDFEMHRGTEHYGIIAKWTGVVAGHENGQRRLERHGAQAQGDIDGPCGPLPDDALDAGSAR